MTFSCFSRPIVYCFWESLAHWPLHERKKWSTNFGLSPFDKNMVTNHYLQAKHLTWEMPLLFQLFSWICGCSPSKKVGFDYATEKKKFIYLIFGSTCTTCHVIFLNIPSHIINLKLSIHLSLHVKNKDIWLTDEANILLGCHDPRKRLLTIFFRIPCLVTDSTP